MTILEKILAFAANVHGEQKRKYSGMDYIVHPIAVMNIVKKFGGDQVSQAAALLHDVLEDTAVNESELFAFLQSIMPREEAKTTFGLVIDLTDVYTKEKFPTLNRKERKFREAERQSKIHPDAQTIKYADIVDNALDITKHDQNFAKVYLRESKRLIEKMDKGNTALFEYAIRILDECLEKTQIKSP